MGVNQIRTAYRQQGTTLIELIIAIVVLGIAAVGILTALGRTTVQAVDPMLRAQSLAIAQSFMDEVTSRPFYTPDQDPALDETNDAEPCPTTSQTTRTEFDHICAYHQYSESGINTPDGSAIEGLEGYSVLVEVSNSDISDPPFNAIETVCILRIRVTTTDPSGNDLSLTSYRTSYWRDCE